MAKAGLGTFLRAAGRSPKAVATFAPTSTRVARRMASVVPPTGDPVVLELGAGTGAITNAIVARLGGRGRHLAIELDTEMVEYLRQRQPSVEVIQGSAADLDTILADAGVTRVDAIVDTMPWTLFPRAEQERILEKVAAALKPGAAFTNIVLAHSLPLAPARRFRGLLRRTFTETRVTPIVWTNVPPALTYVSQNPRAHSAPSVED